MTARAVFPGAFSRPVAAVRAHSSQKRSTPASWSAGMAPTAAQQATSETMLTVLAPARSTRVPPASEPAVAGSPAHNATIPAFPALPVVSSTSHGTPTSVMPLPATDSSVALRRTPNGRGGSQVKWRTRTGRVLAPVHDGTAGDLRAHGFLAGSPAALTRITRWRRPA